MSQKGQLDRLPVAHLGPVMALDWCGMPARSTHSFSAAPDNTSIGNGLGWLASGGLDRSVKVSCAYKRSPNFSADIASDMGSDRTVVQRTHPAQTNILTAPFLPR